LKGVVASAAAATWPACRKDGPEPKRPPNIVLIVADDLGIDALDLYGAEAVAMPRLARLAAEGMKFETVWSSPLCTPSRVQLLSGRYPCHTGWAANIQERFEPGFVGERFVDPALPSIGRLLRDKGYATAVAGKWQLCRFDERPDHPRELGFDEHCLWAWMREAAAEDDDRELVQTSRYWNPSVVRGGVEEKLVGAYGPDVYTDFLIDFARRHRDEAFFAYLPMALPHPPYQPTPAESDGSGDAVHSSDPEYFPGMLSYLDGLVGRVVDAIDELGLAEQTLVLFLSDNGTPSEIRTRWRGVPGSGGKGSLREAGIRVPMIARWPSVIPKGRSSEALVDLSDLMPTLAEVAGAELPEGTDGTSFLPALVGGDGLRSTMFAQLGDDKCLRGRRWKIHGDGRLFDLINDPFERNDVGGDPARSALVEGLRGKLDDACR